MSVGINFSYQYFVLREELQIIWFESLNCSKSGAKTRDDKEQKESREKTGKSPSQHAESFESRHYAMLERIGNTVRVQLWLIHIARQSTQDRYRARPAQ